MEKMYKAIIVDDEESAADNLKLALRKYDFISVEGMARNGVSGIRLAEVLHPDIVFLDVELPDMLGMDWVKKVQDRLPDNACIVFYTAYDKYVIDAFRNKAFDCLLKPIDPKDLEVIVTRIVERRHEICLQPADKGTSESDKTFMVVTPTGDLRFLHLSEIGYFRYLSTRKIWEVALFDGTFLPLRRNTTAGQLVAFDSSFIRVHQSYIINLKYLVMVQDNRCVMYPPFNQSGEVSVSKKYKKQMIERFYQL